jgi:hypothetical protein
MMENNSGTRRVYNVQMMAQQAQALDALQKVSQLEKAMEPDHPDGKSENPMPDFTVSHIEVYQGENTLQYSTDDVCEIGRVRLERQRFGKPAR